MKASTAASANTVRAQTQDGLASLSTVQGVVLNAAQSASDVHLTAAREHGEAVLGFLSTLSKSEPADALRVWSEAAPAFIQASSDRATRLFQDLWNVGQKASEGFQGAVRA